MDDQWTAAPSADTSPDQPPAADTSPSDGPESAAEPAADASLAPTRRRRRWVWIVAAAVLLALAGGGYWGWTVMQAQALAKTRATAAVDAEAHWGAAARSLAMIKAVSERIDTVNATDAQSAMPALATSLERMRSTATEELAAAEKAVALLPAGDAKTTYVAAIADARDAIEKAMVAVPILRAAPDFYLKCAQADTALDRARDRVNAGVSANNAKKWDRGIASANQALADLNGAETTLKKMKAALATQTAISDEGGITPVLKLVSIERTMAQSVVATARAWKARSQSRYEAAIARYNKAVDASDKVIDDAEAAGVPDILHDPTIFADPAVDALKSATMMFEAASTFHEKALRASIVQP